jgi:hypothetical protein
LLVGVPFPQEAAHLVVCSRRRRIGEYNTVVWRIQRAETSNNVRT